jgi:three-Cys-motif partner protein
MEEPERDVDPADFFHELQFWSRIKLRLLRDYIESYVKIRSFGRHPVIYYVDGFAGQGTYGKEKEEGSPLIMARFAQRIAEERRGYSLVCLNVELRKKRCLELQKCLAEFDPKLVQVFCGAFNVHLPRILEIMKGNAPTVCFLDPFGVVGISPGDLRPLLVRSDTEFLLNLKSRTLHRLAGSATSDAKEAPGKFRQLSRTLGEDPDAPNPEWLQMRQQLPESAQWEEWAVRRYMQRVQAASPHRRYGMAYAVRQWKGGGVKYYLVFASRSLKAFPVMNDLICAAEDDLPNRNELAAQARGQMTLLSEQDWPELARQGRIPALKEDVHAYGLAHQRCNRTDLIEHFCFEQLGQFMKKHYRQAVKELIDAKRIEKGPGSIDTAPLRFL